MSAAHRPCTTLVPFPDHLGDQPPGCSTLLPRGAPPIQHVQGVTAAPTRALRARYSALFLRRSTMIPKNRTAKTAQTTRTVEASNIGLSPFLTLINSTSRASTFRRVLHIRHRGYQFPHDLHGNGPYGHHEQRRQNTKENRENQLNAQLGGLFLGDLTSLDPHEIGVSTKALSDACSKTVRLDKHSHQLFEIVHSSTLGQVPQGLHAPFASFQLQVHKAEFLADLRMGVLQLLGNL